MKNKLNESLKCCSEKESVNVWETKKEITIEWVSEWSCKLKHWFSPWVVLIG